MKKLPTENKWNYFWDSKKNSRFTKNSWSKTRMIRLLDQIIKEGMIVIDVGCGCGFFSSYFISKGCKVYSLDYSKEALEIAKEQTKNKAEGYLQEDILNSDFAEKNKNKFDLIFSDGLLEHFSAEDQKRINDNLKIIKKPDGIIATFVPNKYSWWQVIRPMFMPGINEYPFTMGKLKQFYSDMEIVESGGLNLIPFAFSPDKLFGSYFGMILYLFAR